MTPSTPIAMRIGALYNRRPSTNWSDAEIREYKKLFKDHAFDNPDDLGLIEKYYKAERKKGKDGVHRRDLLRLLRYWNGEMDRAREWKSSLPKRTPQPKSNGEKPMSDNEWQSAAHMVKQQLSDFRNKFLTPQQNSVNIE